MFNTNSTYFKTIIYSIIVSITLIGCGGGGGGGGLSGLFGGGAGGGGAPGKGPFKEGSLVTATKLTISNGTVTRGDTQTATINSSGRFSMPTIPWTGPTEFLVEGQYLDENTGEFVAGGELKAFIDVQNGVDNNININILTHMAYDGIVETLKNNSGKSVAEAKAEAKAKIAKTFKIDIPQGASLEDLDITDGEGTNAAANTQLLKLSASLLKTDAPEKLMEQIAEDLKSDDEIDEDAVQAIEEIKEQEENVDLALVGANIETKVNTGKKAPKSDDVLAGKLALNNGMVFTDSLEVPLDTSMTSNSVVVDGIYGTEGAAISISGGEYSIDNGTTWSSSAATINNGDTLQLKGTSSSEYDTTTTVVVTIGGVDIDYNIVTESDPFVADTKAKKFNFTLKKDQTLSAAVTSDPVTVEGINTATAISITNGTYSINSTDVNDYTSNAGTVVDGDVIRIKHPASDKYKTAVKSVLTLGEGENAVSGAFVSITVAQDVIPNSFSFATKYDTDLSTTDTDEYIEADETVTVAGITGSVTIEVINGEYSLNGGTTWTSDAGTVQSNDQVNVRHKASTLNNTKTTSSLIIGRSLTDFVSYTKLPENVDDTVPNEFTLGGIQKDVALSSEITSSVTIAGINAETEITILNGEYSLDSGTTWISEAGVVNDGDTVDVRHTSSDENLTQTVTTLTIGGISSELISFTKAPADRLPVPFGFPLQIGVDTDTVVALTSQEAITIKGISEAVDVTVLNGEYSLDNGNNWTSSNGTVNDGDSIIVRHTSSAQNLTKTVTTLTIGEFTTKFISITKPSAPQFVGGEAPAAEIMMGQQYSFKPNATGATSWRIANKPKGAIFNKFTGELKGVPLHMDQVGTHTGISIFAKNDGGEIEIGPFAVTVLNFIPELRSEDNNPTTTVAQNASYSFTPVVFDKGTGETHTFSATGVPAGLSIDTNTGAITGNPTQAAVGQHTITVTVKDSLDATDTLEFDLTVTNVNDLPTGAVTISGTKTEGQELTVTNDLADEDGISDGAISYQWKRDGVAINGATNTAYTLTQADVGTVITVTATYTDDYGIIETVTSAETSAIANLNNAPTGTVTIDGIVAEDETLTASNDIADEDGMGGIHYQWKRDGSAIDGATESTYTLTQADVGTVITVTAIYTDAYNTDESVTSSETIAVINVNDEPTGDVTITGTATEDQELTASNTLVDEDGIANGAISYQWKRDGVAINEATSETYTLVQEDVGTVITVTATYTDEQGTEESKTSTATTAVANVNDAPTGDVTITGTATEDQELTVSNTLVDEDGIANGAISYQWKRDGVAINGATNTAYTLVQADVGTVITVTATYTDEQGTEESKTSTATTPVLNVNDRPVITSNGGGDLASIFVVENTTAVTTITSTDEDGDTVTYTITGGADQALFTLTNGVLTFANAPVHATPADSDTNNTYIVEITATDNGDGTLTDKQTITVEVIINATPVLANVGAKTLDEDTTLDVTLSATDAENDSLTFSAVSSSNITASVNGTTLTLTPAANFYGSEVVTVKVTDGYTTATEDVTVTVTNVNDAPTISGTPSITVAEDSAYPVFTPTVNDIDTGDTLTFAITNKPTWAAFDTTTGILSGTPNNSHVGTTAGIVISVTDGNSDPVELAAFSIEVTNTNDAPTISGTPATTVAEDSAYPVFTPTANDDDGDTLTFAITNKPAWATFDPATGALSGTPDNSHVGTTAGIVISVTDGNSPAVELAAFSIEVTNTNDAPTISGTPATTVAEDSAYVTFTPTANDDDGDTLTFAITNKPDWATFDPVTGALSGTPDNSHVGITTGIVISVTDGNSTAVELASFNIEVTNVNDIPEFANGTDVATYRGQSASGSVSATDVDNDNNTLTYSVGTNGSHGTAVVQTDGSFTYTSNGNSDSDTDSFTIIANDGTDNSAPVTVNVTIKDAHVAVDPYIVGAQFCADTNGNGSCDDGEPLSTLTNDKGEFTFSAIFDNSTPIIMVESVKGRHLGIPFDGLLKGKAGNSVTSPLTTMNLNGFTPEQIVGIMNTAGITGMTTDHLAVNPMAAFEIKTAGELLAEDFTIMQGMVAVNTFLRMTSYGLTPNEALDQNNALVSPYDSLLSSAVQLAELAINANNIANDADPRIIVYIGVAISNYLVDQVATREVQQAGSGQTFLSEYLTAATNDFANSDFNGDINLLIAKYEQDSTRFYKLSDDGSTALDSALGVAIAFNEYGNDWVELKDKDRNNVILGNNSNNVSHDDNTDQVTLTAYKSDTTESRSEIKTSFETRQNLIQADVNLVNSAGGNQRLELTGYMGDSTHSSQGVFVNLSVRGNKIFYYMEKDNYDAQGNITSTTTLEDGDLNSENSSYEGTLISGSFENTPVRLAISVDPSSGTNGVLTFTAYDGNGTQLASQSVTLPESLNINLGFTSSKVRVRVKQTTGDTFTNLDDATVGVVSGFTSTDLTYTTTTVAADTSMLLSGKTLNWIDIAKFENNGSQMSMQVFEKTSLGQYVLDGGVVVPVSGVDGDNTFNIEDENGNTVETITISDTRKFNVYEGNTYTELYRSIIANETQVEKSESSTWNWTNWHVGNGVNDSDLSQDIAGLVALFTNGNTYFQDQDVFMTKADGKVVLGTYTGNNDNEGNKIYSPSATEVGTWTSDTDSIDVDLSINYKMQLSFSLDQNNNIVDSRVFQAGYTSEDYIWTGSSIIDFFEDVTGSLYIDGSSDNLPMQFIKADNSTLFMYLSDGIYLERGTDNGETYVDIGTYVKADDSNLIGLTSHDGTTIKLTYDSLSINGTITPNDNSGSFTINKAFDDYELDGPFSTHSYDNSQYFNTYSNVSKADLIFEHTSCEKFSRGNDEDGGNSLELLTDTFFCHKNGKLYATSGATKELAVHSSVDYTVSYGSAAQIDGVNFYVLDLYQYDSANEDEGALQVFTQSIDGNTVNTAYSTHLPFFDCSYDPALSGWYNSDFQQCTPE